MVRLTDLPAMTIAVDLGPKATKQTKSFLFDAIILDSPLYISRDVRL